MIDPRARSRSTIERYRAPAIQRRTIGAGPYDDPARKMNRVGAGPYDDPARKMNRVGAGAYNSPSNPARVHHLQTYGLGAYPLDRSHAAVGGPPMVLGNYPAPFGYGYPPPPHLAVGANPVIGWGISIPSTPITPEVNVSTDSIPVVRDIERYGKDAVQKLDNFVDKYGQEIGVGLQLASIAVSSVPPPVGPVAGAALNVLGAYVQGGDLADLALAASEGALPGYVNVALQAAKAAYDGDNAMQIAIRAGGSYYKAGTAAARGFEIASRLMENKDTTSVAMEMAREELSDDPAAQTAFDSAVGLVAREYQGTPKGKPTPPAIASSAASSPRVVSTMSTAKRRKIKWAVTQKYGSSSRARISSTARNREQPVTTSKRKKITTTATSKSRYGPRTNYAPSELTRAKPKPLAYQPQLRGAATGIRVTSDGRQFAGRFLATSRGAQAFVVLKSGQIVRDLFSPMGS